MQVRLHIRVQRRRSTVTLDRTLFELLALRLCGRVETGPVQSWAQRLVEADPAAWEYRASQRLAHHAALAIASEALQEAFRAAHAREMTTEVGTASQTRPAADSDAPAGYKPGLLFIDERRRLCLAAEAPKSLDPGAVVRAFVWSSPRRAWGRKARVIFRRAARADDFRPPESVSAEGAAVAPPEAVGEVRPYFA